MDWLLTWVCQGSALALLVTFVFRVSHTINASTRYLLWWITLVAVLALPWAGGLGGVEHALPLGIVASVPTSTPLTLPAAPAWAIVGAVAVWVAVTMLRLVRVAGAVRQLQQLKDRCVELPAGRQAHLPLWRSVSGRGRRVRLCVSTEVGVASVLGLTRPLIVLPLTHIDTARLSDEQLDQIVMHEYAHVRRRDDWARLGQVIIEAVFGLHPAVWWIGRTLDLEREIAADDWVVACCRSARGYARCLTEAAALARWPRAASLTPGATRSRRELSRRVERLLDRGRNALPWPSPPVLAAGFVIITAVAVQLGSLAPLLRMAERDPIVERRAVTVDAPAAPGGSPSRFEARETPMPPWLSHNVLTDDTAPFQETRLLESSPMPMVQTAGVRLPPPTMPRERPDERQPLPRVTEVSHAALLTSTTLPLPSTAFAQLPRSWAARTPAPEQLIDRRPAADEERAGWRRLADAGTALGQGLTNAGRATAGAFTDLGSSFARVFR